jgi:hypothetical protein
MANLLKQNNNVKMPLEGRIVYIQYDDAYRSQYLVDTEIHLPQSQEHQGQEFILRLNNCKVDSRKLPPKLRTNLEKRREEHFREHVKHSIATEVSQQMQGEEWVLLNDNGGDVEGIDEEEQKTKAVVMEILQAHVPQAVAAYCLETIDIPEDDCDWLIDDWGSFGESLIDRKPVIIQQGDKTIVDLLVEVPKEDPLELETERRKLILRAPEGSKYEIVRLRFAHRPNPAELEYPELNLNKVVDDFYRQVSKTSQV